MNLNIKNCIVIAQKEFADDLWSPRFLSLLSIFALILFSFSYHSNTESTYFLELGFVDVAQIIAVFLPLFGITLGFDRIVKEKRNASLNVLLTQPVYRDSIIAGKVLGAILLDLGNNEQAMDLNAQLQKLTPVHYYSELVIGHPCMTWGGFSNNDLDSIRGIFDENYTIGQWLKEYIADIIVLISTIITLFIMSFVSFLKQDITN